MKRRDFIKKSSLAFTGASFSTSNFYRIANEQLFGKRRPKKVIIIGAGLSGLVAAYELKKVGCEVIVLEAQTTPGGRVRTIRKPFADGLHAEVGASRIHENHHLVHQYAKLFQLRLVPFYPTTQNDLLDIHGKLVKLKGIQEEDYAHYSQRYKKNIYKRIHHPVLKIEGGMDRLPKAFANTLKDDIYYGTPVVKLEQNADSVKAFYERAGVPQYIEAERLICTLPFSVLKHIETQPAFSAEKSQAIFQMPYYATCRILFQTRKRFWEEQNLNGFGMYENGELWHPTFDQRGPRGILAYYPGQYAVRNLPNEERVSYAMKVLKKFYPQINEYVEGHFAKFWDEDQYAQGAVSAPEAVNKLLPWLVKEEGRIHFAGEHISSFPRWMEGALESGLRVAKEVNETA